MPYCLRCRFEYREGLERCPECGGVLADSLLPGVTPETAGPVAVWRSRSPLASGFAQLQLERGGVPSATGAGEIVIFVPAERAEEAQRLLSSAPSEGAESIFLSQIAAVRLTCAACDRVRRVDLENEEFPQACFCGRSYEFGPALEVLNRLRALVREVQEVEFDIELELESEAAEAESE